MPRALSLSGTMQKFVLVVALFSAAVAAEDFFHLQDGFESRYRLVMEAVEQTKNTKIQNQADFLISRGKGNRFKARLENVALDKQLEKVTEFAKNTNFLKQKFVFEFGPDGLLKFFKPAGMNDPQIIYEDKALVRSILEGKTSFTRTVFVPLTLTKCNGDFTVTELDDTYEVDIKVDRKCVENDLTRTQVDIKRVLFRNSLALKRYEVTQVAYWKQENRKNEALSDMRVSLEFMEFVPIPEKEPKKEL